MNGLHSWIQPPGPLFILLRLIELLDLLLEDVENAARRVAVLELGGERVGAKVLLCARFVSFQGIIKNKTKVRG
jgi:hypothetical protein